MEPVSRKKSCSIKLIDFKNELQALGLQYKEGRSEWLLPMSPPIHTGRFSDFVTVMESEGKSAIFSFDLTGESEMGNAEEIFIANKKRCSEQP